MRRDDSWTFRQSVDDLLHVLLYVRAALGVADPDAELPPADVQPPTTDAATPVDGARAAWQLWWDGAVGRAALLQGAGRMPDAAPLWLRRFVDAAPAGARDDPSAWADWSDWRYRLASTTELPVPPTFDGVDPILRPTAHRVCAAATGWASSVSLAAQPQGGPIAWEVVRDAAEAVASDTGTAIGRLDAVLLPLAVRGPWWRQWGPGVGLCSIADLTDRDHAFRVCYGTLASSI